MGTVYSQLWNLGKESTLRRNMMAKVTVKVLFEVSNNMVSGDGSAKKGTQLSVIKESYING